VNCADPCRGWCRSLEVAQLLRNLEKNTQPAQQSAVGIAPGILRTSRSVAGMRSVRPAIVERGRCISFMEGVRLDTV
jgi:hypothetical protein